MDRTPETCPSLPDQLTVEFGAPYGNPSAKFVRFIVFEQEWAAHQHSGLTQVHRSVKDIVQFDGMRQPMRFSHYSMKKWLRKIVRESPGQVLENVALRGDIGYTTQGDEEPQVSVSNVRLTDHTIAMVEYALQKMANAFIDKGVPNDSAAT